MTGDLRKHGTLRALFAVILLVSLLALVYLQDTITYGDENIHRYQIEKFTNGEFDIHPNLTTLPTFHAIVAGISRLFRVSGIPFFRFINFLFAFFALFLFFKIAEIFDPLSARLKTLQLYLLPIAFPFWHLVYTDALSLLFLFSAWYFLLLERSSAGAVFGTGAWLTRQLNFIWFLFVYALDYFERRKKFTRRDIISYLLENKVFVLSAILFVLFIIWNGGVALGDKEQHPSFRIYFGNFFIILIYSFFAFLPLHAANFKRAMEFIKTRREMIVIAAILFVVYIFTSYTQKYNQPEYVFYAHNILLKILRESFFWKTVFFFPAAYALVSHITFPLLKKSYSLFYIFTILSLLPSWLIEPRYYILPSALFLLLRKKQARIFEYTQVLMYGILSAGIFLGIAQERFFL